MQVVGGWYSQPAVQQGVPHLVRASREEWCKGNCVFRRSNSLYPISPSQMLLGVEKVGNQTAGQKGQTYFNGIKPRLPSYWPPIGQVSRSSSLTTPTLKDSLPMDTLKLPDPRFFPHSFKLLCPHLPYTSPPLTSHPPSLFPQETELCLWWLRSVLGLGLIPLRLLVHRVWGEEKQSLWPGGWRQLEHPGIFMSQISVSKWHVIKPIPHSSMFVSQSCFCLLGLVSFRQKAAGLLWRCPPPMLDVLATQTDRHRTSQGKLDTELAYPYNWPLHRRISNESEASWYTTDLLDVDRKQVRPKPFWQWITASIS